MGFIKDIFNFDNIGCKIKSVTKWFCWISILLIWIAAPITFICLLSDDSTAELCWIPLVSAIVSPAFIWFASWLTYAFGEFVEDIHSMRKKYYPIAEEQADLESEKKAKREAEEKVKREEEEKAKRANEEKVKRELMYKDKAFACPNCNNTVHYGDTTCETCRQRLDWSKM